MSRINVRRIRKAVAAGVAAFAAELSTLALAGGPWGGDTVGAAAGLAVGVAALAYATRNKLGVNELREQLDRAVAERRP